MAQKSSRRLGSDSARAPRSNTSVSRRRVLKGAAAAVGGGTAALLGAGQASAGQATTAQTPGGAGQSFRAYVRFGTGASVQELRLRPISDRHVVVRTEAAQICYTTTQPALATTPVDDAAILGHGGVGTVVEVGAKVSRIRVGDRVIVSGGSQCGECYSCLHGRADRCVTRSGGGPANVPIADMQDGTPVTGNRGGCAELMVAFDDFCVPVFTRVSSVELAMLHDCGLVGLAATMTIAPVEAGSDVVVLGCGPLGLSAVQGARIKGAAQIIAVDPIGYRREAALQMGATTVFDPNVEGGDLVPRIRELCSGPTDRTLVGGGQTGPDFVIEAAGGDLFQPRVEVGPDPTGLQCLRQAWDLCSRTGHVVTTGIGHPPGSTISFPANQWANAAKNHHPGNLAGAKSKRDIPRFVKLIERGLFDAGSLATATFPIDRSREAFEAAAFRTTIAAIVVG